MRLIDESGKQLGIYPIREALRMAEEHGVDLVEIAPNAKPPVCRLLDYSKFIYERNKRDREARRAQKQIDIKEIRLRPKTAEHDMMTKVRQAREFLNDGAKVRVRIRFRGREITHQEIARDLLAKMADALAEDAIVEQRPSMDAMTMLMILAPNVKTEKKTSTPEV